MEVAGLEVTVPQAQQAPVEVDSVVVILLVLQMAQTG